MILSMDEIVNAICLHMAERKGVQPTDVVVELSWDEDTAIQPKFMSRDAVNIWWKLI